MRQNIGLIFGLDILVVNWFAGFGVYPTDVKGTIRQLAIEMLDEAHNPGHLDAPFDSELASGLHLPTGSRAAPRADFGKSGDHNHFLQIDEALQIRDIGQRLG